MKPHDPDHHNGDDPGEPPRVSIIIHLILFLAAVIIGFLAVLLT